MRRDTKILKSEGKLGQGVGALKRGGGLELCYKLWDMRIGVFWLHYAA